MKLTTLFLRRIIENEAKWMLDSDRTFKIKARSAWTVFEKVFFQQLFALKEFRMEKRLSNIFETTNIIKLSKAILKSFYRVLQVTCKWKTLKRPIFKGCWILAYFLHSDKDNFSYILRKVAKLHVLESRQNSLKIRQQS